MIMKFKMKWVVFLLNGALLGSVALAGTFGWSNFDGWTPKEIAVLASLRLSELPPAPPDPSNVYEKLPAAVSLGKSIFFDRRFSGNGAVSCASCHQPDKQFQDGRSLGLGMETGTRRTMPVVAAGYSPFLFWDGRKDSLWSQALGPLEDPAEHGSNRLTLARVLQANYRAEYEAVFGPMLDLSRLPVEATPLGTPEQQLAWLTMDEDEREGVSRVFANMGKALAAYQNMLQYGESRLDRYIEGLVKHDTSFSQLLNAQEKQGLRLFIGKGQCVTCHNGPLLTDQHFHNTGVPPRQLGQPDAGRAAALTRVRNDEFNCLGRFSDARPEQCEELRFLAVDEHAMMSSFKTPSLRDVALRAPYMHAGQHASLEDVIRHYAKAPQAAAGHSELKPFTLSESEMKDLVAFLGTLSAIPKRKYQQE